MSNRIITWMAVIASFVLLLSNAQAVNAQDIDGDKIVFGESYTLYSGDTIDGNLIILGGNVSLETKARVTGDILLSGGNLSIQGIVEGDITAVGGNLNLGSSAVIEGDIDLIGTSLNRSSGSRVQGRIRYGVDEDRDNLGKTLHPPVAPDFPRLGLEIVTRPLSAILWALFLSLSMGAIAVLIGLFVIKPTEYVGEHLRVQPVLSLALGLLTLISVPLLLLFLALTIILLPVVLLLVLGFIICITFAWLAVGFEVGSRLAKTMNVHWAHPVSAGIGTLLLTLVSALVWNLPCIGWIFSVIVICLGIGAIITSRFGTRLPGHNSATADGPGSQVINSSVPEEHFKGIKENDPGKPMDAEGNDSESATLETTSKETRSRRRSAPADRRTPNKQTPEQAPKTTGKDPGKAK